MNSLFRPVSVVAIRGGFGNQLFAWAYGQGLENKGHVVAYDPGDKLGRGFVLDGLVRSRRLFPVPACLWRRVIRPPWNKILGGRLLNIEDQRVPPITSARGWPLTLHWGYWQSLDHFAEVRSDVFDQLSKWLDLSGIDQRNVCAIHVRRGDYVSDSGAAAVMGVLPLSYYRRAIEYMKGLGHTRFVVYSDDRPWVTANLLPLDEAVEIANTQEEDDFINMARSKGLITANSSFSWWAGFLVESLGGSVAAPRGWFAASNMDSSRLIPDSWEAL